MWSKKGLIASFLGRQICMEMTTAKRKIKKLKRIIVLKMTDIKELEHDTEFIFMRRIGCFAHTLQLITQNLMNIKVFHMC